jgi:hypothetical protein
VRAIEGANFLNSEKPSKITKQVKLACSIGFRRHRMPMSRD